MDCLRILLPAVSLLVSTWLLFEIRFQNRAIEMHRKRFDDEWTEVKAILDKIKKTLPK